MKTIRLGVVGIGRIGKMHVENINQLVKGLKITAVADVTVQKEREWLAGQGIEKAYTDYKEMLAQEELDAVLIACSTTLHSEVCFAAAKAGKHVFCEKPLAPDIETGEAMIKACKDAGVKLQVGFNRRFDHNHKKVRDIVQSGKIGEPQIIRIASRDPQAPSVEYVKTSGGILLDMTIHDFDMARYITGYDVTEVFAAGAVLIDPEIGKAGDIDTVMVHLRFSNGALGVVDNSRQALYGYDQRLEVFGSKGQVLDQNDRLSTVETHTADGEQRDKICRFFLDRYTQAFVDEFVGFVRAIEDDTAPLVDGHDAVWAMKIAIAANESLKTGLPVKID